MDLNAYLQRIGYRGEPVPTLETLRAMHRAHAFAVPFENLDISRGVRIEVDETVNFEKIVRRGRGGFCLELTGLFARALREIGFDVDVIGARVMTDGHLGHPMSHMTLIVHLDEDWIADVGFGGRIVEPLRLNDRGDQVFGLRRYVVENDGDHWFVTCAETGYASMTYLFIMQPREFDEFHEVCRWLQTSPESRFTQGDVISLATADGRNTLAGRRLITFDGKRREERELSEAEAAAVCRERFGFDLPPA
ncbi:MAG TPA: arylamine N-acetyltransferase [Dehalococcoidia bacterium]|nr:arylamine N-acetyltransferase [Dehalococcoidia bacterium]